MISRFITKRGGEGEEGEGGGGEKRVNKNPYHCIKTSFENTNNDWGRLEEKYTVKLPPPVEKYLNRKFRALVLRIRTDVASSIIECKHHDVAEMACERHMQTSNHAQSTWSVYGTKGTEGKEETVEDGFPMHFVLIWKKNGCQIMESLFKIESFVCTRIKWPRHSTYFFPFLRNFSVIRHDMVNRRIECIME